MLLVVVVVLLTWNNLVHLAPAMGRWPYVPANLALAGLLWLLARRVAGCSAAELGADPRRRRPGVLAGAAVVVVVALGLGVALAVPWLRPLLEDGRFADRTGAEIAWHALGRVPFGTAVLEEVAFRGVLIGLLARRMRMPAAVVTSSIVFGLWHVRPAAGMMAANDVAGAALVGGVAGSVVLTAVAGVGFCLLRLWSGHLLAPIVAHAGMNSLGTVAAHVALQHA